MDCKKVQKKNSLIFCIIGKIDFKYNIEITMLKFLWHGNRRYGVMLLKKYINFKGNTLIYFRTK